MLNISRVVAFYFSAAMFWGGYASADDIGDIAKQLTKPITGSYKIAVMPLDPKKYRITAKTASSITEKLTNAIQNSLSSSSLTLVERAKLTQIMDEQQTFKDVDEFSRLLANAGADIIIVSSANRLGDGKIEFSARAIGAAGTHQGKVFSASKTIIIHSPIEYSVAVSGVMFGGTAKPQYENSLIAGLAKVREMRITEKADIYSRDFQVSSKIEYQITAKETAQSTEAKQTKSMLGSFSKSFGGTSKLGNNPVAQMMKSMGGSTNPDDLKLKLISVNVTTKLEKIGDNSIIIAEDSAEENVPFNSEKSEIVRVLKSLVRKLLQDTGEEVALRALNKKVPKKKRDLLD